MVLNVAKRLLLLALCLLMFQGTALARPMDVLSVGFDKGGNEASAVEKMRMAATGHSLAFIIPPSQDPNSDFVRIVKAHYQEVTSNPRVLHRKNEGALVVTGQVIVDWDSLKAIVRKEIRGYQEENADAAACFLIRVTGINDPQQLRRAYGDILQTYGAVFENLGFKVEVGEEVTAEMMKNPTGESYEAYCDRVSAAAREDIGITYAVIGEIAVNKLSETDMGITWGSTAHLQARDFTAPDERVIFDFADDYKLKGKGELMGLFAMRKAAMNSSRALAEHTLAYWKGQH